MPWREKHPFFLAKTPRPPRVREPLELFRAPCALSRAPSHHLSHARPPEVRRTRATESPGILEYESHFFFANFAGFARKYAFLPSRQERRKSLLQNDPMALLCEICDRVLPAICASNLKSRFSVTLLKPQDSWRTALREKSYPRSPFSFLLRTGEHLKVTIRLSAKIILSPVSGFLPLTFSLLLDAELSKAAYEDVIARCEGALDNLKQAFNRFDCVALYKFRNPANVPNQLFFSAGSTRRSTTTAE